MSSPLDPEKKAQEIVERRFGFGARVLFRSRKKGWILVTRVSTDDLRAEIWKNWSEDGPRSAREVDRVVAALRRGAAE